MFFPQHSDLTPDVVSWVMSYCRDHHIRRHVEWRSQESDVIHKSQPLGLRMKTTGHVCLAVGHLSTLQLASVYFCPTSLVDHRSLMLLVAQGLISKIPADEQQKLIVNKPHLTYEELRFIVCYLYSVYLNC